MTVATAAFGERLEGLILAQYPTRDAFAEKIGMKPTYLSRILKGHIEEPTRPVLRRFADGLGMSVPALRRSTGLPLDEDEEEEDERGIILALMMAHPQAGPMLVRLKAEASVEDYPALLEEALDHFAMGLGRQLRKRREDEGKP